jgi:hypothetical protein
MKVLEDQHDRLTFAEPAEDAEHAFEEPPLTPLRRRDAGLRRNRADAR